MGMDSHHRSNTSDPVPYSHLLLWTPKLSAASFPRFRKCRGGNANLATNGGELEESGGMSTIRD